MQFGGPGNRQTYPLVLRFQTAEGRGIETQLKFRTSHTRMRRGQRVTVAYDPADPHKAEVVESSGQIWASLLFAVLGAVFFPVGVYALYALLSGL